MNSLALYVHIPFCTVKCGYCDFNTYAGMDALKPDYTAALTREIAAWPGLLPPSTMTTIAFGGGTPGEMSAPAIDAVVQAIHTAFPVAAGAEVSLEANPGTSDSAYFEDLRRAGITRLSLGAQSFDDAELKFLDRIHSPQAVIAAFQLARDARFESINLDLIYGLPGQSLRGWLSNLEKALALNPDHLSLYALTVEPGTPLAIRVDRGEIEPADADLVADMYEAASDRLAHEGFEQYEISNWARPGHRSLHNQVYWTDGDYLGIGAGAHGYIDGDRYENIPHPRFYISKVNTPEGDGRAILNRYRPEGAMARSDWLTARLRALDGFDPAEFAARFGEPLASVVGEPLRACAAAGLLELDPLVRLTPAGRLLHGEIAARILAHLNTHADGPSGPTRR